MLTCLTVLFNEVNKGLAPTCYVTHSTGTYCIFFGMHQ